MSGQYLVQASSLSRIFLPEFQAQCLADPESLLKSCAPFTVVIPRPTGSITLVHNVPVVASSLVVRTKERNIDDDEVSPLVRWLTEENEAETDIYGVVAVPIETNVADAIMSLIHDKDGEELQMKLIREIKAKMAANITEARARADARVMRQCQKMYETVFRTVQAMKKDGKGEYSPSYSEALALDILSDQIAAKRKPDGKSQAMFDKAMNTMAPTLFTTQETSPA